MTALSQAYAMRQPDSRSQESRVQAILGPTNTGKTHYAIERLVAHSGGIIGFPLRLLARENYDKVAALRGRHQTALITGEEKIVPPGARYFLCTVESMPIDRRVPFLAVDEIQLCADFERGHTFTDRLLRARGEDETLFLGSETMAGMIRALIPEAEIVKRPRFSTLTHAGYQKITKLPRRAAAVTFSANDVYALAELIRRHRGGTAVVLGALSPRTRNAQVAMYQAGEVDYLVATDAIGMGLNMDVDHVAFASTRKFDGAHYRSLRPHEIGQIAGRAGRHVRDGTFGTTASARTLEPEIAEAVEEHRFDAVRALVWRNHAPDYASIETLMKSLDAPPPRPELSKIRNAEDQQALLALSRDEAVSKLAKGREAVALLWQVCQIPDFRKVLSDAHLRLLTQIYGHLRGPKGVIPDEWMGGHIARLEQPEGDIDGLMARIAHIRTWTYITHCRAWLSDPDAWQERTRAIEDRLSDALHERLTQRFVDRRSASLIRGLKGGGPLTGAVRANNEVLVEGEYVGLLKGFRFEEDATAGGEDAAALQKAARKTLSDEIQRRVAACLNDPDKLFQIDETGQILWRSHPVGRLIKGDSVLTPRIEVLASDLLDGAQRDQLMQRFEKLLADHLETVLGPLLALKELTAERPAVTPPTAPLASDPPAPDADPVLPPAPPEETPAPGGPDEATPPPPSETPPPEGPDEAPPDMPPEVPPAAEQAPKPDTVSKLDAPQPPDAAPTAPPPPPQPNGAARGIAYQLYEALGCIPRSRLEGLIKDLDMESRRALGRAHVRLGPVHVYGTRTTKTNPVKLKAMLWAIHHGLTLPAPIPPDGRTSCPVDEAVSRDFYTAIGYPVVGPVCIRVDILDRVINAIHDSAKKAPEGGGLFVLDQKWADMLGTNLATLEKVIAALGYQTANAAQSETFLKAQGLMPEPPAPTTPSDQVNPPGAGGVQPAAADLAATDDDMLAAAAFAMTARDDADTAPVPEPAPVTASPDESVAETAAETPADTSHDKAVTTAPPEEKPPPIVFRLAKPRVESRGGRPFRGHPMRNRDAENKDGTPNNNQDGEAAHRRKRRRKGGRQDSDATTGSAEAGAASPATGQRPDDGGRPHRDSRSGHQDSHRDRKDQSGRGRDERRAPKGAKGRGREGGPANQKAGAFKGDAGPMTHSPFAALAALKAGDGEAENGKKDG